MTSPAGFATHVFISYSHIDNPPVGGMDGWVTRFHTSLESMLTTRIGRDARIWRDVKLSGNDIFSDEIVSQFPTTALLICIVTPRYIESEWCTKELDEFCKAAERNGSLVIENRSRIIKVIKTPVDERRPMPSAFRGMLGYPFYVLRKGAPVELDAVYGPDFGQQFHLELVTLAWRVAETLGQLGLADSSHVDPKATVFLASCAHERNEMRSAIEADLLLSGYRVLPDVPLPIEKTAHEHAVSEMLAQSQLAIHLIGSGYGLVPDGPGGESVVVIQNELAARHSRETGLPRVIWIPDGIEPEDTRQHQFITTLHRSADLQFGADVVTTDIETVKGVAHAALAKLEQQKAPPAKPAAEEAAPRVIYLVCDERDRADTLELRRALMARGFDVQIPVFEGASAELRMANEEMLNTANAVMVYYGKGEEAWKRIVEMDIKKARAHRSGKALPPTFSYLAQPETRDKLEMIALDRPNTINGLGGLAEDRLEAFLALVR